MDAFLSVILEVAVILILILVGYFTVKKGMFTKESLGSITSFLLYIVTPCLIVSSFLSAEPGKLDGWTMLLAVVLPALSIVISIAVSYMLFRREPLGRRRVLRFSTVFCNVGFMGIPLVEGIVGSEGVLYGSFFIAVFNIFCWTYGYVMMGGGKVRLGCKGCDRALSFGLEDFEYLVLWSKPGAPLICVEPWGSVSEEAGRYVPLEERADMLAVAPGKFAEKSWTMEVIG